MRYLALLAFFVLLYYVGLKRGREVSYQEQVILVGGIFIGAIVARYFGFL